MSDCTAVEEKLRGHLLAAIEGKTELSLEYEREGSATGVRTVAPHAIFRSGDRRLFLYAFQRDGASSQGGLPAWRRFALEAITSVDALDSQFKICDDYDPASKAFSAGLIASVR